jgi:putative ABC transport system permease protein
MLRNALAAALRHLARSRLYTAVSVVGLALGLSVVLMVALVIRNQYSFDHDLPGYQRTWAVLMAMTRPGQPPQHTALMLPRDVALEIEAARVGVTSRVTTAPMQVEVDGKRVRETVHWADAALPEVLPQKVYAGDAAAALRTPDGVLLSRSGARRFFGHDAPLGETLKIDGHPLVVRALVEDPLPNATHEPRHIIAAGVASWSPMSAYDKAKQAGELDLASGYTYLRLTPGSDISMVDAALSRAMRPYEAQARNFQMQARLQPVRIDRLNSHEGMHPGFRGRMSILGVLGAVVLLVAGINFVNLQTARSMLRAREVAIRSVAGARRSTLMAQFLGEALLHAAAAMLLAVALAEWLLPHVNAFLDTGALLDYRDPRLLAALAAITLLFGLLAGAWPAFVLSGVKAVDAMRGTSRASGGGMVRQGLVTLQFALLITLAICAGVVHRQRQFALHEALSVAHEQVLMVYAPRSEAFMQEVRTLPGVRAATGADVNFLGAAGFGPIRRSSPFLGRSAAGSSITGARVGVQFDLFDFYGIRPLAGRLPANGTNAPPAAAGHVVVNESAVRKLGLGSPAEALEKTLPIEIPKPPVPFRVMAVVPDFSLSSVAEEVPPTIYLPAPAPSLISVRLSGRGIPEALAAIDALLVKTGNVDGPVAGPLRFFLDEHFQRHYQGVLRQSQAFGLCALIAIVLSCVGLFALTAATVERRTREIGIRKALGAQTGDVLRLLLWQFSKPVLWANVIAWPVAGWAMQRWLDGFAYRTALPMWLFPMAAAAALLIALLTVAVHSLLVARAKPVAALRHE